MKKVILLLCIFLLVGCGKYKTYQNISYSELNKKLVNKETFAFVIGSKTCSACAVYKITMEDIISEYNIPIYFIETSDLSEEDYAKLISQFYFTYTPTTVFIKDGSEITTYDRFTGAASYSEVVSKLKKYEIIKEN